ncbi:MAG: hypothetical protein ACRD0Y_03740 [Terriglobales bacterium]
MASIYSRMRHVVVALMCLGFCLAATSARAQYFGQNKVRHKSLHFSVLKTKHFDIYFYPEEKTASVEVGRMAERWYARYTKLFHHVLTTRQAIVLYASHTDFEQTTVLPGFIGQGTGGVTTAIGRKVVLPLAGSLAATDHVLGHELVHAYQYDMTLRRGSPVPLVARLPLWFVEGMAEYCSLGPKDANTAMWMRDAVARDKFPTIKDLDNASKYFPYRYGEAFWAFVGGRYGDSKIAPMLLAAASSGRVSAAIQSVLHVSEKQLSAEWKQATEAKNHPILQITEPLSKANVLIAAHKGRASLNVSPAISADGKWVMFYSERGVFAIDLFLANAHTGKVVRQITSTAISAHFNNLEFINGAGAWAPDSNRFAFGHVEGGKAYVSIYDVASNQVRRRYLIPGAGEVFSPTWSPDGKQIAFSAIEGGLTNLYMLDLSSGKVSKLTNDAYAELEPAWSPDGKQIAVVTDRFTTDLEDLAHGEYRLALFNLSTGAMEAVPAAGRGNQINPQWSPDGSALYYISDASGIASIYRLRLGGGGAPEQLTNLQTGVSGITALSPALSVAAKTGAILYSEFSNNEYSLVRLPAQTAAVQAATAAMKPALLAPRSTASGEVATYLHDWQDGLALASNFTEHPYHPTLHLDYIAPPSVAVGISNFGTLLGGGTALQFSDLLGYRHLTVAFESLSDTGGAGLVNNLSATAVYTNDRHRWTWGFGGGQTPFVTGSYAAVAAVVNGRPVAQTQEVTQWQLDRQAVGILEYPFSRAQRIEFTGGYENIGFAAEQRTELVDLGTGTLLGYQEQSVPAPPALNFAVGTAALVYDTSIFGGTSPVRGQSYRLQMGGNAGSIDFATALADYRRYIGLTDAVSLAGRVMTYGRYGSGADDPRMQELYLGYPSLVRGYDFNSFSPQECGPSFQTTGVCPALDRLLGSKIGVVNLEARLELTGPLGLYRNPSVPPVELAPFFDAGTAWTSADKPNFLGGLRKPVSSEGITLRGNAFGFAVVSVSYAFPNNRPGVGHVWEFSFLPGF